jgi:hypothetical protein
MRMINITNRIVVRDADTLDVAVRKSIASTVACMNSRLNEREPDMVRADERTFQNYFSSGSLRSDVPFSEDFLTAALSLTQTDSQSHGAHPILDQLRAFVPALSPPATGIPYIKHGFRLVLVDLWQNGSILLPTVFTTRNQFRPLSIANTLYKFLLGYSPSSGPTKRENESISVHDAQRMLWRMPRALFATSWSEPSEVMIEEVGDFQRAQRMFVNGSHPFPILPLGLPWSLFLHELLKVFPEQVSFTKDDLQLYSQWVLGHGTLGRRQCEKVPL